MVAACKCHVIDLHFKCNHETLPMHKVIWLTTELTEGWREEEKESKVKREVSYSTMNRRNNQFTFNRFMLLDLVGMEHKK